MDLQEIPKLKHALLTERLMLAVDPEMKKSLEDLKRNHDIDVSEWIRRILRSELPKLRQQLSV